MPNGRQAHLYVMAYENCPYGFSDCYKIGRTGDFDKRLKTLNAGHMANLTYVSQYVDCGHLELLIHDELDQYRVQQCNSREWFKCSLSHIDAVIKKVVGTCICFA